MYINTQIRGESDPPFAEVAGAQVWLGIIEDMYVCLELGEEGGRVRSGIIMPLFCQPHRNP